MSYVSAPLISIETRCIVHYIEICAPTPTFAQDFGLATQNPPKRAMCRTFVVIRKNSISELPLTRTILADFEKKSSYSATVAVLLDAPLPLTLHHVSCLEHPASKSPSTTSAMIKIMAPNFLSPFMLLKY
jgi:hypothetical protein